MRARPGTTTVARVCFAPDEAIRELVSRSNPSAPVRFTPWGVHMPDAPRQSMSNETRTAAVVGSGEDAAACAPAILGLADACRRHESLIAFLDAAIVRRQRSLWRLVRKQGLASRVSLVEGLEARRDLTLEADILIQPEALGQHRTITLDAMAHGMIVVARRDEHVSALRGEAPHAILVDRGDAAGWSAALRTALDDPAASRLISEAATDYIRRRRLASAHARAVIDAYEWMAGARSLPFPEAATA
jgi:glycosyltransferase involved in cell wall biosynthesis